jgi:CheY-like chemotaxis protein
MDRRKDRSQIQVATAVNLSVIYFFCHHEAELNRVPRFLLQRLHFSPYLLQQAAQVHVLRCLSEPPMTRILIVDDSPSIRRGLRTLLGLNSDWQVCGEAVNGADAVEKARELAPDIILMDFSMPQMDGVQAAREIAKSGTDTPILLFTRNLSPQIMELARNAGLRGAISKSEISKIPYAIKAFQCGETFFYAS